ncbi:MAG: hypothetical protein H0T62_14400 [Parachlamydiaceae bacterium]|nr:hypothetical protein [Parachlamydiaceae bacterium]
MRQKALSCLNHFRKENIDENNLRLIKSCIEGRIVDHIKVNEALPLLTLGKRNGKELASLVSALEKHSIVLVKEWVDLVYTTENVNELIKNNPSIAQKHLAENWIDAKNIILNRKEDGLTKATCLYGTNAQQILASEVCKVMNIHSVTIGAALNEKGEIKLNTLISKGIKMNVAYIQERGVQHGLWRSIEFVLKTEHNQTKMVHCVALQ